MENCTKGQFKVYTQNRTQFKEDCTHKSMLLRDIKMGDRSVLITAEHHLFSLSRATASTLLSMCPSLCLFGVNAFSLI